MYANPFDISCKLSKELDAVLTQYMTNIGLHNRSCCVQTFITPFILRLPSLLCSAFSHPIRYVQPSVTPSIVFSLQLSHPLFSAFNYPIHYVQHSITHNYVQTTVTPPIIFLSLIHISEPTRR